MKKQFLQKTQVLFSKQRACTNLAFVPKHKSAANLDIQRLQDFVGEADNLLVITGAGISTESGIPDYRSEDVGLYATSTKRPIQHKVFMENILARQSYWARNFVGWPRWSGFVPNINHLTIAKWEREGKVGCLITQNVDQLHYKAGSRNVIELHGTNSKVVCMSCSFSQPRIQFQRVLEQLNPTMITKTDVIRPDGDVELTKEEVENFVVPNCPKCGNGILKPYVVFFGDNVPASRVGNARKEVSKCDKMLVIGSSLYVFSAFRFINQAREERKPIGVINIGPTRADKLIDLKIEAKAGDILPKIIL